MSGSSAERLLHALALEAEPRLVLGRAAGRAAPAARHRAARRDAAPRGARGRRHGGARVSRSRCSPSHARRERSPPSATPRGTPPAPRPRRAVRPGGPGRRSRRRSARRGRTARRARVSSPRATSATRASSERCARSLRIDRASRRAGAADATTVSPRSSCACSPAARIGSVSTIEPAGADRRTTGRSDPPPKESDDAKGHRDRGARRRDRRGCHYRGSHARPGDGTGVQPPGGAADCGRPSADLTDVYAFRSPDKPSTVTILANVIPGEDPAAGPNWYTFSPGARYNLKIDTTGDVPPDVIYRFQFQRKTGPFFLGDTAQPYTVTRIAQGASRRWSRGARRRRTTSASARPRTTGASPRSRSPRSTAAPRRRSRASVTTRSSATSGRSSTSSRSARAPATWAAGRTSSRATASTRSRCRSRSPASHAKNGTIGVWASVDRRKVTTRGATTRDAGPGCRSTGSATRSSTR